MSKKVQVNKKFVEEFVAEHGYPEVGYFGEDGKKDLQKFYKHLSMEQLNDWIELEGLEYTPVDSEQITRMRACMAILYSHYPKAPTKKKESKYSKYSLEDLVQMAMDKEVVFEVTDDDRIMRMRAIMALRAAGHLD